MADEQPNTPETPEGAPADTGPGAGSGTGPDAGGSLDDAVSQDAEDALSDAAEALGDIAQSASEGEVPEGAAEGLAAAAAAASEIVAEAAASNEAQPVDLPSLTSNAGGGARHEIDLLSDVDLDVTIELGRTRMLVEDVLRLDEGVVVELDKLAGDPVDVYVNNRLVARGEVLVLNDNFCVRVNEILAPVEEDRESE